MKQRLYDFIPVKHLCVGMSLCGIVAGTQTAQASPVFGQSSGLELPSPSIYQQSTKQISGIVKDQAGIPVIGANVIVKGTTNGTITDNHRARWRFPTGSSGKRYLRDQLYRLYDAKYPDKRENDLQHHPRRRYAEIG